MTYKASHNMLTTLHLVHQNYYNCEKYPMKMSCLVLIEQYLPNVPGHVYSVPRPFMWLMWLNWQKSTFYPITTPHDFKMLTYCDVIDPWASHTGNCDATITDYSRGVFMDAFLFQWRWGQWFKEFVKYMSVLRSSNFITEKICGSMSCLAIVVIVNCRGATWTAWIKALIILPWQDNMRTTCGFSIELIRNLSIRFVLSRSYMYVNLFANRGRITQSVRTRNWSPIIYISLFTFLFTFGPPCFTTGHRQCLWSTTYFMYTRIFVETTF